MLLFTLKFPCPLYPIIIQGVILKEAKCPTNQLFRNNSINFVEVENKSYQGFNFFLYCGLTDILACIVQQKIFSVFFDQSFSTLRFFFAPQNVDGKKVLFISKTMHHNFFRRNNKYNSTLLKILA